ncbi:MAG: ABC transporter ATP-binding protein [Limnobacter sp.]|nr:ABC transporter ATP-binding protein [Limnobacter sp.]
MIVLECKGVEFCYPNATSGLEIKHFELKAGESVFLTGPSGSGKTTFLNLCAGVLLPQKGSIDLMGKPFHSLSEGQRDRLRVDHIGFVFQQFNLLPYLSVLDNVLLPAHFSERRRGNSLVRSGVKSEHQATDQSAHQSIQQSIEQSAHDCLEALGLQDLAERKAAHLSVGQQQRVAVARALLGKPDLIIADEPSSALDDDNQRQFMHLLLEQCHNTGAALMMVSHDLRLGEYFQRHEKVGLV